MGNQFAIARWIVLDAAKPWRKEYALYRLFEYLEKVHNFDADWDESDEEAENYIEFSPESVYDIVTDALLFAQKVKPEDEEKAIADFHRALEGVPEKKPSINNVVADFEKRKNKEEK